MRTISQAVEEVIGRSPFLAEVIADGVANHAEVARRIKPDVEKRLYETVSQTAIAMALHRLAKELRSVSYGPQLLRTMKDITVRSNLVQFVCTNSPHTLEGFETITRAAKTKKDVFLNFTRGLYESMIVVSKDLEDIAKESFGKGCIVQKNDELSAVTMRLPEETLAVPGVYYPIMRAVALEGINLVEVMSVRTEFSILLKDGDVDRAFSAIKKITL